MCRGREPSGLGSELRCQFTGMQSEQLLFEQQDMLFQGELENAYCQVGRYIQQKHISG